MSAMLADKGHQQGAPTWRMMCSLEIHRRRSIWHEGSGHPRGAATPAHPDRLAQATPIVYDGL